MRSNRQKLGLKLVLPQLLMVALITLAWWHVSLQNSGVALLGGLAGLVPSYLFSQFFFGQIHAKSPQRVLIAFYVGEFLKLVFSVTALLVLVKVFKMAPLPLMTGFIGAHVGTWFLPLFKMKQRAIRP